MKNLHSPKNSEILLTANNNPVDNETPNSLAAIWSMMLPGLGQLLKGQAMPGIIWAFLTAGGYYSFFWPGIIIHTLCVLDAGLNRGHKLSLIQFLFVVPLLVAYIFYRNLY
jgi:TM2 domain-containing membrane protein YozV